MSKEMPWAWGELAWGEMKGEQGASGKENNGGLCKETHLGSNPRSTMS